MGVKYNQDFFASLENKKKVAAKITSESTRNDIAQQIAERGVKIADGLYSENNISVFSVPASGGKASVVAHGDQIAYLEYGTGEYAQGTYRGNLPKSGVPLTGSWKYYYPSKNKRTSIKTGLKGWFHNKRFHIGSRAGAQMWNTARSLRMLAPNIARKAISEALKEGSK